MGTFPSKVQKRIIDHRGRPLVVVAGPGTGKTATIVARMTGLIAEDPKRTVSFLTFTRASSGDTRSKVEDAVGKKASEEESGLDLPRVTTLHGFAKSLVHRYAKTLGISESFSIPDVWEANMVVEEAIEDLEIDIAADELLPAITCYRSTGEWPDSLVLSDLQREEVLLTYDELLRFYDAMEMEGMVWSACEILTRGAETLPPVFLQVDEYQDLNPTDQKLVGLASASESSQVVVVGDDAQSIYKFRHANPAGIRDLWTSADWNHESLDECHRLPPHILLAANALVRGRDYLGAQVNLPESDDKAVLTLRCTKSNFQGRAIVKEIARFKKNSEAAGKSLSYGDFMFLCPNKTQASNIAKDLTAKGIPVKIGQRKEMAESVRDFVLLLRLLLGRDSLALRQWLVLAGLGYQEIRALRKQAQKEERSLFDLCEEQQEVRVTRVFNGLQRLRESQLDPGKFRDILGSFPGLTFDDAFWEVVDGALAQLPFYGKMIAQIRQAHGILEQEPGVDVDETDDSVLVSTMHSSKGLEAEIVFIPWMNDGFMPTAGRDVLEEERVFYVALTRAKRDVVLLFFEKYDTESKRYLRSEAMSPFLKAIPDYLHIKRVTAEDLK